MATAPTTESDLENLYPRYHAEIKAYEAEFEKWRERGKKVVKHYRDADNSDGRRKRFNVLWSNVQTLKPALYARDPKPEIERRFQDRDPVARAASDVLERCASFTISSHGFSDVMRNCVDDRLLPGRGVCWVRYAPTLGAKDEAPPKTSATVEAADAAPAPLSVLYEQALIDYVHWEDFGHNVARFWDEVTIVWRKVYMSRAELVAEFGAVGNDIPLDYTPKGVKDDRISEPLKKACIYEGWDKTDGVVWFLSKQYPKLIKYAPDPLGLNGGFPCPKPLYATTTTDSLIPVPDYALYQTQAQELETLTARIDALTKALRVVGVYDASSPALEQMLSTTADNRMIPVEKWAAYGEKGGLKAAVDFLPIEQVANVLTGLFEARERAKQDLYEITGIADIIRGNSEPNETATAQQIKGRFAVLRISDSQQDVQRFARDVMRLVTEIIAEHFSLDTIRMISGVQLPTEAEKQAALLEAQTLAKQAAMMAAQTGKPPPPPPAPKIAPDAVTWEQVHELIKHDVVRDFRIEIETDSTIRTDEDADRMARTEFLTAASGFLRDSVAAVEQTPAIAPLLGELLMFGVRGFKTARSLEPTFEQALQDLKATASQPKPNPEMAKVEAQAKLDQQKAQTAAQLEQSKQASQAQQETLRQQMENARAQSDAERTAQLERYKAELQSQLDREKAAADRETAIQVAHIKAAADERIAVIGANLKREELTLKASQDAEARESEREDKAREKESESEDTQGLLKAAADVSEAIKQLKALRGKVN